MHGRHAFNVQRFGLRIWYSTRTSLRILAISSGSHRAQWGYMSHSGFRGVLQHSGFRSFLATQFLGAFNDSVYQNIVALHAGATNPALVPLVPAVFTVPSLLFSGYS